MCFLRNFIYRKVLGFIVLQKFLHAFCQFLLQVQGIILAYVHRLDLDLILFLRRHFLCIAGKKVFLDAEFVILFLFCFFVCLLLDGLLVSSIIGTDKPAVPLHLLILCLLLLT